MNDKIPCPNEELFHLKCGTIKTRTPHKCQWCENVITKGTVVRRCVVRIPYTNELETRYYCKQCLDDMELYSAIKDIEEKE